MMRWVYSPTTSALLPACKPQRAIQELNTNKVNTQIHCNTPPPRFYYSNAFRQLASFLQYELIYPCTWSPRESLQFPCRVQFLQRTTQCPLSTACCFSTLQYHSMLVLFYAQTVLFVIRSWGCGDTATSLQWNSDKQQLVFGLISRNSRGDWQVVRFNPGAC